MSLTTRGEDGGLASGPLKLLLSRLNELSYLSLSWQDKGSRVRSSANGQHRVFYKPSDFRGWDVWCFVMLWTSQWAGFCLRSAPSFSFCGGCWWRNSVLEDNEKDMSIFVICCWQLEANIQAFQQDCLMIRLTSRMVLRDIWDSLALWTWRCVTFPADAWFPSHLYKKNPPYVL